MTETKGHKPGMATDKPPDWSDRETNQPGVQLPTPDTSPDFEQPLPRGEALETAVTDARQATLWGDAGRTLRRNPFFLLGSSVILLLTVMAIRPQLFTDTNPTLTDLSRSRESPSAEHWFGFDVQGHDYFTQVIYGARVSMIIGVVVVGGILVVGVTLGAIAGFYGGPLDSVITRLTDVLYGIPFVLAAILILQTLPSRGVLQVSLALIAFGWLTAMRLVRASVIAIKEADYVQAARALGGSDWRIITRHILPNSVAPVLVYATIAAGSFIAAEATLSFLGIGLRAPAISWGLQINVGQRWIRDAAHLVLIPGLFLSTAVLAFIMVGDALRDALDPKLR